MIKIFALVKRREGMTREEFSEHWLNVHGPISARWPGMRRYVQNMVIGGETGFDGLVELGFDDEESMEAFYQADFQREEVADLPKFLNVKATVRMVALHRSVLP